MALTNRHMAPGIETVFVMPSVQYSYVSSSLIREIVRNGGDVASFLPPQVERRLRDRLRPLNSPS
jgi:pantetheine-phosphate adenylyltransferase